MIATGRLVLRPLDRADAPAVTRGLQDWEVAQWLSVVPWPYRLEDAHWFIGEAEAGRARPMAITRDGGFIGVIEIAAELGYWIARPHWGRGYVTEAATALIDTHFADPDAPDIRSGHFLDNTRSAHVLHKLGFARTGVRTIPCRPRAQDMQSMGLVLTRAGWEARAARV